LTKHHIGVIGGSGLYDLEGLEEIEERDISTPFGRPSDRVVSGVLGETRFYFLPRHGRGHGIPPNRINYRANVLALKQAGAQQLVSVSAVGSLREHMHPGHLVFIDQFIDRTRARASSFFDEDGVVAHVELADPVDAALANCLADAAEGVGATLHRGGTYVCIDGPQFSTRAESHMYRTWGADIIGMTNLPEARLAREAQLPYATMALVTDFDCWHEAEEDVNVEAVLAVMQRNVATARQILAAISCWPDPSESPSSSAMAHAVLTSPDQISPAAREKLADLLPG